MSTFTISCLEQELMRVLYSFPHRLGAGRICYTAWQQVNGLAAAGAQVTVCPSSLARPVPKEVRVESTLAWGKLRVPYKLLGSMRAFALHDHIVADRIKRWAREIDIVHTWPLGALETLRVAWEMGIPTVLERPNAHTRFAYDAVQKECSRIGVTLPRTHEHAYKADVLKKEEREYQLAYKILCPSDFTLNTFLEQGFSSSHLVRHIYGYDDSVFYPSTAHRVEGKKFTMLFVGVCAVRKGLHFALDAWLRSPAHLKGEFLIAGEFLPAYREKLSAQLADPSVKVLGQRNDIASLMRNSDALILPSVEEGFGLVCTEAIGSGCVPLVSEACTELCVHMQNALVHPIGDVSRLAQHITLLCENRDLLHKLRESGLQLSPSITWKAAGERLFNIYRDIIKIRSEHSVSCN
jgi:glycosyltransferase involved in cell wall biosynthesis